MTRAYLFLSWMILGSFYSSAIAFPPGWLRTQNLKMNVARDQVYTGFAYGDSVLDSPTESGSFDQQIDHFSASTGSAVHGRTFKQRYFIDTTFAKGLASPVIYVFCGEGECGGATSIELVNTLAQEIGAYRVALEHRYYGYSQPFGDLTTASLTYLTMEQQIEDLAEFQRYLQATQGLTGKWISVGGSYAGELSAFYRLKHPELVSGALASSGPVRAKANFEEYDHLNAQVTRGECLDTIQKVMSEIETRMKTADGKAAVKALFDASKVTEDLDFLYVVADMGATAIQYGYQNQLCSSITAGAKVGQAVEAYAKAGTELFAQFGLQTVQDTFGGAMSTNPADYLGWAGWRSWLYQSCTQLGFYQTAYHDPAESARSAKVDLEYHHQMCDRLFGIKSPVDTIRTNQMFYEPLLNPSTSNIFYTNGANDPWSQLSITNETPGIESNPNLKLFTIAGASHCDDLGSRFNNPINEARAQFKALVKEWLK